jgi:GT2 family glycosyltransferase/glycosyltransferase involved in cell wall biosynthesis
MFAQLPSLRGFQPKFYSSGPARFHLPLLYDLAAETKPKRVVVVGFGDGQMFFTFCQAAVEQRIDCECIAVRRAREGEPETDDAAWREGRNYGEEFYGESVRFFPNGSAALAEMADGSVDLLLLDDSDSGKEIESDLGTWKSKLGANAVVLAHGLALERQDNPRTAWEGWVGKRAEAVFREGLGLGIALLGNNQGASLFVKEADDLAGIYSLVSARIDAMARTDEAEKAATAFQTRQVWLDSLLADRRKVQEIMDHQAREIVSLEQRMALLLAEHEEQRDRFENLRRDRVKAQLIMDAQEEQLKHWTAQAEMLLAKVETLKGQLKEHKAILKAAKAACRKKGRCFQIETGPKVRRPLGEKILRELGRLPRNLGLARKNEAPPEPAKVEPAPKPEPPRDRYQAWIAEHEPDATALKKQREGLGESGEPIKISLLTPVHNTPGDFLEEMFASVAAQTYENWELCVIDAGSDRAETLETVKRWAARNKRIRLERLEENLGIAENTNRALKMATGDFVACLDHDDLIAPFALYELARAAAQSPETDIWYSDEDRLDAKNTRYSPFFKPKWSPELLLNYMYVGHLSAYRRTLAVRIGGFRKEFDLSQDYDFALRATEQARRIGHIPHVLYHWREHPASGSTGGKPGARRTNLAALAEAMRRRSLDAEIIEYPTANRARLKIRHWPRVSIIVPTDSPTRAHACLTALPDATKYPDLEIVLVTHGKLAESLKVLQPPNAAVRLVSYDQPFNFSDKCNAGAAESTGERLIFLNDDVEAQQPDWIQELIEPLENPEVGAVAPKLLYETGKIQHAGLVTGVRGLVGTACHQWPAGSTDYTNFAQSMRDVSALSAACLALRRNDFFRVGEFDAVNTPIAHSDLDLCFKVREAGLRCVYTPFVTMRHAGHASIGAVAQKSSTPARSKASVFLLRRWGAYATHDPYFPDNLRDWLYADSPTPIRMWSPAQPAARTNKSDLLFVSHDLTWSGAPLILLHTARFCQTHGYFVAVMSPSDGPLRAAFVDAGVPVIVDPLIATGHPSFAEFAREFDCVVASTIFGAPVIRAAKKAGIPHLWWIHEGRVAEHYIGSDSGLRAALAEADFIVTPDTRSSLLYQPFSHHAVRVLFYGIPDPGRERAPRAKDEDDRMKFLLLGTIEPRKGQPVVLEALRKLPDAIRRKLRFSIVGRPHDLTIAKQIRSAAEGAEYLEYREGVSPEEAHALIAGADVVVSASTDETGPIILMEALALGKPILATNVGAVAEVVAEGQAGLFFKPDDATALAAAIKQYVDEPKLLARFEANARGVFEKHFRFDRFANEFVGLVEEAAAVETGKART